MLTVLQQIITRHNASYCAFFSYKIQNRRSYERKISSNRNMIIVGPFMIAYTYYNSDRNEFFEW